MGRIFIYYEANYLKYGANSFVVCVLSFVFYSFCFVVRSCFVWWTKTEPRRGLVDRKLVQAPSNFIAGRPKAALLLWFFGDFRCGVLLFMVILVIYKYKNR